jgi:hypothetical protein
VGDSIGAAVGISTWMKKLSNVVLTLEPQVGGKNNVLSQNNREGLAGHRDYTIFAPISVSDAKFWSVKARQNLCRCDE